MPRYHFHLHGEASTLIDREGQVLPDAAAARAEAQRYAQGLSRERGSQTFLHMAVQDTAGAVVCHVPVHSGSAAG